MDTCEQIVRDLLLHEDSWPFTQAVNLREVGFVVSFFLYEVYIAFIAL